MRSTTRPVTRRRTTRDELGGGLQTQQWISNAHPSPGCFDLTGGSLGDIFGRRRIFAIGVGGFGLASLVCALAPSSEVSILGRALQGAAVPLAPSSLAVIAAAFPSENEQPLSAPGRRGAGSRCHRPAGGRSRRRPALVALDLRAEPPDDAAHPCPAPCRRGGRRLSGGASTWSAGLGALGLAGIVIGLTEQPRHGWSSAFVLASLTAVVSPRGVRPRPASRTPADAAAGAVPTPQLHNRQPADAVGCAGLAVLFFFLSIFLQQSAGWSAVRAGLIMVPVSITMFILSRRVGRLADRYGPRIFLTSGPLLAATAVALPLRVDLPAPPSSTCSQR